jgi:deoxyribonuclease-4
VFHELDRRVGLAAVRAFHLNDSKTVLGSGVDRHQEIGDGTLGLFPFWRLVNDHRFAATPASWRHHRAATDEPASPRNLKRLRALIGARRPAVRAAG